MAEHDMDSADLRDAYIEDMEEEARRGAVGGSDRKPDAVRIIGGTRVNGLTSGEESEFHLGHWETMQISLALMGRVNALRDEAAQARIDARAILTSQASLDTDLAQAQELLAQAANLEDVANNVSNMDFRMFQHATTVTVTRFDHAE